MDNIFKSFVWKNREGGLVAVFSKAADAHVIVSLGDDPDEVRDLIGTKSFTFDELKTAIDEEPPSYSDADLDLLRQAVERYPNVPKP